MKAYKCDRCGSLIEIEERKGLFDKYPTLYTVDKNDSSRLVDLCETCSKSLNDWLYNKEGSKRVEMDIVNEDEWTDEDCDGIGCWECKYFRQDKNIHNPYDEKDAYYCSHKKLYISGNVSRPDYMDMRYTDFDKLGCKEEE